MSLFGEKLRSLALHKHQFEPYEIYNHDSLDNFIRGMASQPTQDMDSSFSRQVRHNTRRISHAMGPYICNLNLPSDTSNLREFCELFRPMNWKVSWPANGISLENSKKIISDFLSSWKKIPLFLQNLLSFCKNFFSFPKISCIYHKNVISSRRFPDFKFS